MKNDKLIKFKPTNYDGTYEILLSCILGFEVNEWGYFIFTKTLGSYEFNGDKVQVSEEDYKKIRKELIKNL